MIKLSRAEAQRLALQCSLLAGGTRRSAGKAGAAQVIEHLGYVQIDTINVVERAHHHVLWTRVPGYRPEMLDELLAKDRRVFEFWAHALSYVPMSDYRFYRTRMKVFLEGNPRNEKWDPYRRELTWIRQNRKLMSQVLKRIRKEGPLGTADFEHDRSSGPQSPWGRKPAKVALEMLFFTGDLMVSERRGFQRMFDLTERVLPPGTDTSEPDEQEVARFAVSRALKSMGFATAREIREHLTLSDSTSIELALADMRDAGEVTRITVEGQERSEYFALPLPPKKQSAPSLHILSPFDNLVAARERMQRIFGFDYQLECYKVPAQRKHGYFVLPVLFGDRFIARLDAKTDREAGCLRVLSLSFEDGYADLEADLVPLAARLKVFAAFNGADCVKLEEVRPAKLKSALARLLAV